MRSPFIYCLTYCITLNFPSASYNFSWSNAFPLHSNVALLKIKDFIGGHGDYDTFHGWTATGVNEKVNITRRERWKFAQVDLLKNKNLSYALIFYACKCLLQESGGWVSLPKKWFDVFTSNQHTVSDWWGINSILGGTKSSKTQECSYRIEFLKRFQPIEECMVLHWIILQSLK